MSTRRIPLVDLTWQHREIAAEVTPKLEQAMAAGSFIGGAAVEAFEEEFAAYCAVDHCVGVANGTDALELALRAVGVAAGDRVVMPANTFIATPEAVVRVGAHPVLVDCGPDHLIDVEQAVAAMAGARAIIPVHLYGQMAAIEALFEAAASAGCVVVADAAQSQGASRFGKSMGADVAVAATSFYPGKNLGAYGDAGAVVTTDAGIARRVRLYGNHGSATRYVHETMGCTSRLDAIQAIVLSAKLRRLERWNKLRQQAASTYGTLLADLPVELPSANPGNDHVWHLYVVRTPERDRVLDALNADGIGAAVHYPTPVHLHAASAALGLPRGSFPHAEAAADSILSLPLYPGITEDDQVQVADCLRRALASLS